MLNTTYKFVAILNKKIETGKVLNALAHMSLGLVAKYPELKEKMGFINFIDKDGDNHKSISKLSYVVLRADNSNKIRKARDVAKLTDIPFIDFINTMTEDTYIEQLERTKETPEEELEYFGICMFGEIGKIDEITRKFSLWR